MSRIIRFTFHLYKNLKDSDKLAYNYNRYVLLYLYLKKIMPFNKKTCFTGLNDDTKYMRYFILKYIVLAHQLKAR